MYVFPDPAEIVVDGGPIPAAAAAAIAPDGGDGGAAAAAAGGHLTLNNVRDDVVSVIVYMPSRTIEFRGGQGNEAALPERVETGAGYTLHMYGGGFHRVSADWCFPRCGVQDLWRQWWIGDTVRQVPPLRSLEHVDVKHLDNLPYGGLRNARSDWRLRCSAPAVEEDAMRYAVSYELDDRENGGSGAP
ncbi:hypothetical protein IV203_037228 [Nitzschia inconspicua]|uniref:Uncharacterized protein n=1 Tax=Nitzschia inconspicua TaxID=303405 RepID=A0A9K3KCG6_9STRA|nr:hypothetical protein IV203_023056 [Nitzschia inconspicua]KAG7364026.1 hypothetical protein IV203_037228 [Nitzschia inconspicua]